MAVAATAAYIRRLRAELAAAKRDNDKFVTAALRDKLAQQQQQPPPQQAPPQQAPPAPVASAPAPRPPINVSEKRMDVSHGCGAPRAPRAGGPVRCERNVDVEINSFASFDAARVKDLFMLLPPRLGCSARRLGSARRRGTAAKRLGDSARRRGTAARCGSSRRGGAVPWLGSARRRSGAAPRLGGAVRGGAAAWRRNGLLDLARLSALRLGRAAARPRCGSAAHGAAALRRLCGAAALRRGAASTALSGFRCFTLLKKNPSAVNSTAN